MPLADNEIDISDVMAHIRELDRRYDVIEVAFDRRLFELPAQQLADEGIAMVEMPQSLERMVPAFGDLFEAIQRCEISHDGDALYARQILKCRPTVE